MIRASELDTYIQDIIKSNITAAAWLVRRGHPDLAIELRNEFMHEWEVPDEAWDELVEELIEYVERKGETPFNSILQLTQVKVKKVAQDAH